MKNLTATGRLPRLPALHRADRRIVLLAAIAAAIALIVLAMLIPAGAPVHDQAASMVEYAL